MATQREGFNPLRPYHQPAPPEPIPLNVSSAGQTRPSPSTTAHAPRSGIRASAQDILPDLDYGDYLPDGTPSATELFKRLIDHGLWKYTSVLLAQPFEVAKVLLQLQDADAVARQLDLEGRRDAARRSRTSLPSRNDHVDLSDSDDDSPAYFTSNSSRPSQHRRSRLSYSSASEPSSPSPSSASAHFKQRQTLSDASPAQALTTTSSITAVQGRLWHTEGAWGVWKGTNSTFVYSILLQTLTTFLRSIFCATLALPDPTLSSTLAATASFSPPSPTTRLDILSSPSPMLSLLASLTASTLAAVVLGPIDAARTKLLITPTTRTPRSLLPAVRALPSWHIPATLAPVTVLHAAFPTLLAAGGPWLLRSRLGMDPATAPTSYAVATFASQLFELFVRLPVETVLRRGQLAFVRGKTRLQTILPVGDYHGFIGTMYHIVFEEGWRVYPSPSSNRQSAASLPSLQQRDSTDSLQRDRSSTPTVDRHALPPSAANVRRRKGQGLEGLWRGWRVGVWGLAGIWGARITSPAPESQAGPF